MARRFALLALVLASAACSATDEHEPPFRTPPPSPAAAPASTSTTRAPRPTLNGSAFPDRVIALTWDDGPDEGTLELARYLHRERVSGTFFVVHDWVADVSEEPGRGHAVFDTGFRHLPVLGQLLALGHRVGNHTENHVLLTSVSPVEAIRQLRAAQALLAPYERDELRLFRPPGGAWSARVSEALEQAHALDDLVGPIGWDIDRKDWESSLYCRSDQPDTECEPGPIPGEKRVKPEVIAKRYATTIASRGHGIVLLHDRVGHVRSRYAIEVARHLVPVLKAQGFVFAPPVLVFGPLRARATHAAILASAPTTGVSLRETRLPTDTGDSIGTGDLNGDGRPDACGRVAEGVACALATPDGFARATLWAPSAPHAKLRLVDVNGDGRADLCALEAGGVTCGLAP